MSVWVFFTLFYTIPATCLLLYTWCLYKDATQFDVNSIVYLLILSTIPLVNVVVLVGVLIELVFNLLNKIITNKIKQRERDQNE